MGVAQERSEMAAKRIHIAFFTENNSLSFRDRGIIPCGSNKFKGN